MPTRFPGFPKTTLKFLKDLKKNNNREWFNEHKPVYQSSVKEPMAELILALGDEVDKFAPGFVTDPKKATYRIYRDTRFSNDKTPYKTHVAGIFAPSALPKHAGAAFYFHFSPQELLVGGGLYMPDPKSLLAIRKRFAAEHKDYRKIIGAKKFKDLFGEVDGQRLKRGPKGFSPDDPSADLLLQKQFLCGRKLEPGILETPKLHSELVKRFKALAPWIHWINQPLVG